MTFQSDGEWVIGSKVSAPGHTLNDGFLQHPADGLGRLVRVRFTFHHRGDVLGRSLRNVVFTLIQRSPEKRSFRDAEALALTRQRLGRGSMLAG